MRELKNISDVLELWGQWEKEGLSPKVFEKKSVLERDQEIDEACKKFNELQQWLLIEQEKSRFKNYPKKYLKIDRLLDQLRNTSNAFIEIFKDQEMAE